MNVARRELAARMAEIAVAFAGSLEQHQRDTALWPFDDVEERLRWFYTPTDHGGLPLAAMRPRQQQLAHRLLACGLSEAGYVTAATIIGLDNVLDRVEGYVATWGRERGRDPGLYYLRIFGDPAGDGPWGWRFGGHHVSVQHVVVDGEVVASTPCFLGADPASAPLLGPHLLRPLAGAEDLGRELVRSLDETQLAGALLAPVAPVDLVTANRAVYGAGAGDLPLPLGEVWRGRFDGELGERVEMIQRMAESAAGLTVEHLEAVRLTATPRGLCASALNPSQREVLRALLDTYVRRIPDALADEEASKYVGDTGLDGMWFSWAGSLEPGEGHYYRVQGAELLAEYDNTQRGANHVHTVWRNPRLDFGADALRHHYEHGHHRSAGDADHHH
ncbi:MAG: DUF3500 domain-containing protein [Actinomycetota bacterium]